MKSLQVLSALSSRLIKVTPEVRVAEVIHRVQQDRATHCAVADANGFLGLIRLQDVLISHPQRIFADYLPKVPGPRLFGDAPLDEALDLMRRDGADAVPIFNAQNEFLGMATHESMLLALFQEQGLTLEETESRRRQSEERLRLAAHATTDAIWDWNLVSNELWATDETDSGYSPEVSRKSLDWWQSRLHPEDRIRVVESLDRVIQSAEERWRAEFRLRHPNGTYVETLGRACVVRDSTGRALRVVGVMTDMTERVQLEEKLRQAQKMEALGRLAGGVAHDFNNLLTVIRMNAELLPLSTPSNRQVHEQEILLATERAAKLIRQLLATGRKQRMHRTALDLNVLAERTMSLLRRSLGPGIIFEFVPEPTPVEVYADEVMLEQVLLNLIINARDAMPDGGELVVRTGRAGSLPETSHGSEEIKQGPYAILSVEDTGSGIPLDVLPHIFEPFFTTKGPERGSGLGLATVYGIIQQHHGRVAVTSEVGRGTGFAVYLPLHSGAPAKQEPAQAPKEMEGGKETILLVEDDPGVRRLAKVFLERLGYCILEADCGPAAIDMWQKHQKSISLLLTDMVMPGGMSGVDLAKNILSIKVDLPVLLISGYSENHAELERLPGRHSRFLPKPFQAGDLAEAVKACLAVSSS